jgi:hypothetical protein
MDQQLASQSANICLPSERRLASLICCFTLQSINYRSKSLSKFVIHHWDTLGWLTSTSIEPSIDPSRLRKDHNNTHDCRPTEVFPTNVVCFACDSLRSYLLERVLERIIIGTHIVGSSLAAHRCERNRRATRNICVVW